MSTAKTAKAKTARRRPPLRGIPLRRWFTWHTFRSRITMLVMAAVGLSVALGALISYVSISRTINNNVDNDLKMRTWALADTDLAAVSLQQVGSGLNTDGSAAALNLAGLKMSIVTANGASISPPVIPLAGKAVSTAAPTFGSPELAVAAGQSPYSLRTVDVNGQLYRVYSIPDTSKGGWFGTYVPQDSALVVATSLAATESTLNTLATVSFVVGLIGIALAGAAGFAIGRAALRPVEELSKATEYIARTGDLRSLPVNGDDELAQLTRNFNTMLEALARSQEHQKRLVADAGHELRTPLTSMRTNLDLLAQVMAAPDDDRLPFEERVALMNDVRAQMEELSLLISDLVELSRDEQPSHAIERLDVRDIVDRAAERVQRRAPALTYDLKLSPWYLDGDAAALERLVTNLMDNAAKWSPEGGTVTVTLADGLLQVADQGPGIAEKDLAHVFERFYRSPEARATPGSGLGLAIVRQIAENHGGRVAAARAPGGGALLGVWLPGTPAAEELPAGSRAR
ncbi:HAMP domain-containing histidine kinase [Actinospica sp. MGRD01-02]|uniref:histidine kinase n=1 Tax=Actinospica acidithermotolerans TaxID=2828514 RepID=A0A941EBJ9_9ACTN|nr:HAMP domain-containing sensor histidine kinase [Actinospica acidithermotolerans]MBR7829775.1 HAMP domain-containing histidine kinase [Actinospica acidithermotolerans]